MRDAEIMLPNTPLIGRQHRIGGHSVHGGWACPDRGEPWQVSGNERRARPVQ